MMTAHDSRVDGAAGAGRAALRSGSSVTVRTSWRTVPSDSRAVSTIVLSPSRSVTGAVTTIEGCGVRSACRATSMPFRLTVTLPTPRPDVTTAATTVCASWTREPSAGWRTTIVSGTGAAGGAATTGGAGAGAGAAGGA